MAFFKLLSGENWEIYTIDGAVPCEDIQVVHIKHPKWKTISKLPPMGRKPVRLPLLVHPSTADATQRTSFLPPWKEDDWEFCLHCFLSLLYLSNPIKKKTSKQKTTDWKHQKISNTKIFYLKAGPPLIFLQLQWATHHHTTTELSLNSI